MSECFVFCKVSAPATSPNIRRFETRYIHLLLDKNDKSSGELFKSYISSIRLGSLILIKGIWLPVLRFKSLFSPLL